MTIVRKKKAYKDEEQRLKNAILDFILYHPRKGFAFSVYNGAVYDPQLGHYRKRARHHRKGVPDIIGVWCKKSLFIEVKAPKGILSPEQKQFLEQANQAGAIAFECRDFRHAVEILNSFEID